VASLGPLLALAPALAADESELKAAIVFNVLVFVEWPDELKTIELCASADNPLLPALRRLDGRDIRNRIFKLQVLASDVAPASCRAAFVDASDRTKHAPMVKNLSDAGVFVISDDAEAPPRSTAVIMQRAGTRIALDVNLPSPDGFGMHGSGLFILNPPWTLHAALQEALPWLVTTLGGEGANYTLEQSAS